MRKYVVYMYNNSVNSRLSLISMFDSFEMAKRCAYWNAFKHEGKVLREEDGFLIYLLVHHGGVWSVADSRCNWVYGVWELENSEENYEPIPL